MYEISLWIACQTSNATFIVFTSYFLFVFRCWVKRYRVKNKRKSDSLYLRQLAVTCVFFALLTFIVTEIELIVDLPIFGFSINGTHDYVCEVVMDAMIFIYTGAYIFPYVFLWYRVHLMYRKECLKKLHTRPVQLLSALVIVFIVGGSLFHVLSVLLPKNHSLTASGCMQTKTASSVTYVAFVIKLVTQFLLCGLVSWPLCKSWKKSRKLHEQSNQGNSRTCQLIMRSLKFSLLSLTICLSSDLFTTVVDSELFPTVAPCVLINAVWNLNLLLNVTSITLCFDGFRSRFFDKIVGTTNQSEPKPLN